MDKICNWLGDANASEMSNLKEPMKGDDEVVKRACKNVQMTIEICDMTGRPVYSKKI